MARAFIRDTPVEVIGTAYVVADRNGAKWWIRRKFRTWFARSSDYHAQPAAIELRPSSTLFPLGELIDAIQVYAQAHALELAFKP